MAALRFRNDINGLRALAVTAVVLFHFKLASVSGGYAGVDIFFVISGYLMTLIITRRLDKGSFSLIGFYADRTRRIVPPLYAMVFSLFVFGYFFIDPYSYQKLGSTGISALLFFSNFRFWEATGYFDAKSSTKWLLHTWSLSVEWQFYLIYPIILFGLQRFVPSRRAQLAVLWALTLISLAACIDFSPTNPASTFYLLPFRAWEMLAGGIVALQFDTAPRNKNLSLVLMLTGLVLIAIAIFTFDDHRPWPYYWAIIPVFGTCLVIAARQTENLLFANPVSRFLGDWSYSIYLWHWPIAVATRYFDFDGIASFRIGGHIAIVMAVILAAIYLGERLRRTLTAHSMTRLAWGGGLSAVVLSVLFAIAIAAGNGLPGRIAGGQKMFEAYNQAASDWTYPAACVGPGPNGALRPCQLGGDRPDTLFAGDSFAMQLYPRFIDTPALKDGRSFTFLTAAGCPPLLGVEHNDGTRNCSQFVEKAFDRAESGGYRHLVLVSNWYEYFSAPNGSFCFLQDGACTVDLDPTWFFTHLDQAFAQTTARLASLKKRGLDITIIASTPFSSYDVPIELAKRKFFGRNTDEVEFVDRVSFEKNAEAMKARLENMAKASGASFIDPLPYLCDAQHCATVDPQGVSLFVDAIHFRSNAVKGPRFEFLNGVAGLKQETH